MHLPIILHVYRFQGNRLYRLGVPVNARDGRGHSALHLAVMFGHADVVRLLLEFTVSTQLSGNLQVPAHT